MLAGGIRRLALDAADAGDAGAVDHGAAVPHGAELFALADHDAREVDRDDALPERVLDVGGRRGRFVAGDARHVGASGQAPELVDGGVDPGPDLGAGPDVCGDCEQIALVAPAGFDGFGCALQSVLVDV